jgi:hypothetical protein
MEMGSVFTSSYIGIKKKIKNDNIITIPDGYLLDFLFETNPTEG